MVDLGRDDSIITLESNVLLPPYFKVAQKFSLNGPIQHVFLSHHCHRGGDGSDALYEAIARLSSEAYPIPPGARGRPLAICKRTCLSNQSICKVFVDTCSLPERTNWEAGSIVGLAHSVVFVPLLTWNDSDGGSLGQMTLLRDADRVHKVLLECIVALALLEHSEGSVQAIFPVLLTQVRPDGSYQDSAVAELNRLPNTKSAATNERAAKILEELGLPAGLIKQVTNRTVRGHIAMLLRHEVYKVSQFESACAWQEQCAAKVLDVVQEKVQELKQARSSFVETRPGAMEVLQWLEEHNLRSLEHALIASGVDSLRNVSTVTDQHLRGMYLRYGAARAAADKCCVCENHFKRFELARVALKHDRRAKLMSERLALFVDSRVSWAAACVSSSAVEIIFSQRQLQSVLFLPVLVWSVWKFVTAFILSSKIIDNPQANDSNRAAWADSIINTVNWAVISAGFGAALWEGLALLRPRRAKVMIEWTFLVNSALDASRPLAHLLQYLAGMHSESIFPVLYFRSQNFYSNWVFALVQLFVGLAARRRQEWVIPSMGVCLGALFVLAIDGSSGAKRITYVILLGVLCLFLVVMLLMNRVSRLRAARAESKKASARRRIWKSESVRDENAASLQVLEASTSEVEEQLERCWRQAFRGAWGSYVLRYLFAVPERGLPWSPRYSLTGKVRQRCAEIDSLLERACDVNDLFQDTMQELIDVIIEREASARDSTRDDDDEEEVVGGWGAGMTMLRGPVKQPERVLQKCVRVYRRDTGCLTDLVRCAFVARTLKHAERLFREIRSRSVIFNGDKATRRGGRGEEELGRMLEEGVGDGGDVVFCMTACKNMFREGSHHIDTNTAFRDLALNLEIGWIYDKAGRCTIVPYSEWERKQASTLICEVQIHLHSLYYIDETPHTGLGDSGQGIAQGPSQNPRGTYVEFRDLTAM